MDAGAPRSSRRSFVARVSGVATGAVIALLGTHSDPAVARSDAVGMPRYVPSGFRWVRNYVGRVDGFKGQADEIAYWFVSKDPAAYARPLSVFHTASPQRELGATSNHVGGPVVLTLRSGAQVTGIYQDGMWWLNEDGTISWNNADAHSVSFAVAGRTVGVRGSRFAGVSYDELLRVAASVA